MVIMETRFAVRSHVREDIAVQKIAGNFDGRERPIEVYELEDSGERLTPIGSTVFWCPETSEVYRRVRVDDDSFGAEGSQP
jgi:hypothetical protein